MSDECQSKWQCMIDAGFNSFIGSSKETKMANFKDWDIDCFIHYYIDGMSIRLNKRTWSDFFFWMRRKSQGNCEFGQFCTNFLIATYFVICMCFLSSIKFLSFFCAFYVTKSNLQIPSIINNFNGIVCNGIVCNGKWIFCYVQHWQN